MSVRQILATTLSAVAMAVAALPASAIVVYSGANTSLGTYTVPPGTPSTNSFVRDQSTGFPLGLFDDYYIFSIAPAASISASINFDPAASITGFTGGLYSASGFTCAVTCAGGSFNPAALVSVPDPFAPGSLTYVLAAGQYAIRVQGNNVGGSTANQTAYTGQFSFLARPIPEPATMALVGLGLLGLGATRRRKI